MKLLKNWSTSISIFKRVFKKSGFQDDFLNNLFKMNSGLGA